MVDKIIPVPQTLNQQLNLNASNSCIDECQPASENYCSTHCQDACEIETQWEPCDINNQAECQETCQWCETYKEEHCQTEVQLESNCYIYSGGWTPAEPMVWSNGSWKKAISSIYSNGWKQTI